ncbi:DUF350 domain-containing protein [Bailinhaonella thermotolerans]|uniref:DUF350 domain-containing protein n=1 Tax=Bailinhaonella thermotolerans TaxID=1070861 RepID=A0A3A4B2H5_9ACTN|nr:DUF350 domain-containing protein [Bailinhaonella thermotolerans]RJL34378.1 DUF350 domain-containing protein [Bailinhaonella thermotolerans]
MTEALGEALGRGALAIIAYAVLGLILLIAGFYALDLATPGRLSRIIRTDRNPNATLVAASGVAAVGLIVTASIWASGGALLEGLLSTLIFGLTGIVAQTLGSLAFDRVIGLDVRALISEPRLHPAAVLMAVTHLAIGLIMAVSVI